MQQMQRQKGSTLQAQAACARVQAAALLQQLRMTPEQAVLGVHLARHQQMLHMLPLAVMHRQQVLLQARRTTQQHHISTAQLCRHQGSAQTLR